MNDVREKIKTRRGKLVHVHAQSSIDRLYLCARAMGLKKRKQTIVNKKNLQIFPYNQSMTVDPPYSHTQCMQGGVD